MENQSFPASLMKPIGYDAFLYDEGFEFEPIQTKPPFGSPQSIFSKAQAMQLKQLWVM